MTFCAINATTNHKVGFKENDALLSTLVISNIARTAGEWEEGTLDNRDVPKSLLKIFKVSKIWSWNLRWNIL